LIERGDIASVGTNDLAQYTFAIERDAPSLARFYQPE
jgi:phosphoenolpyruvate-protein kinase (PTS system EI component)